MCVRRFLFFIILLIFSKYWRITLCLPLYLSWKFLSSTDLPVVNIKPIRTGFFVHFVHQCTLLSACRRHLYLMSKWVYALKNYIADRVSKYVRIVIFSGYCGILERLYKGFSLFISVQLLSRFLLLATPWTAAHQASLSITNSWSLLKLMSIESVMPSNHLILCRPLLQSFPASRSFPMN